jgi:radical SAM protein (TIGR01212 family)
LGLEAKPYRDYSSFIRSIFGKRVQKISINTGFSCPNRDGTKGRGGCTYCNHQSFTPDYCKPQLSITQQLQSGIDFFSRKYKTQDYLAYFQTYTNTYGDLEKIKAAFTEAASFPNVKGLVIGTRPDCIPDELIDFLEKMAAEKMIAVELGVESTLDKTLERINRCHTFSDTVKAYERLKNKGIYLGAHLILGLPGESREEMLHHATVISELPIDTLKIHQLQIIKHTLMATEYLQHPESFNLFDADEYLEFIIDFLSLLRKDIVIDRFISESPEEMIIAPKWKGIKNYVFTERLLKRMAR